MNTQGSMFTDVGFSADCTKGTIVAYDDALGIYVPAEARWSKNYRQDGSVIPATSSYVVGVLISEVVNNSGTVLCNGWTRDEELITLLTGGVSGEYYLDAQGVAKPGRVKTTSIPVYCFSYRKSANAGDIGLLVFNPQPPEYAGHSHGKYALPGDMWNVSSTESTIIITNASVAFDALRRGNPASVCLVKNGVSISSDLWSISTTDTEAIITAKFTVLSTDEIVIHTITPFTAEEPIVRSVNVAKSCNILSAESNSGNVRIALNEAAITRGLYTGSGVVGIDNNNIKCGPVVQQLHAGAGIRLSQYINDNNQTVPGSFIVSSEEQDLQERDMMLCNLNGVVLGSTTNATSYVFPKGLNSSMHGTIRAPFIPKALDPVTGEYVDRPVDARINLLVRGTTASADSLSLTVNRIRKPADGDTVGTVANSPTAYKLNGTVGDEQSRVYLLSAAINNVSSCDYLVCTVAASDPSAAIEIVSVSLSLA